MKFFSVLLGVVVVLAAHATAFAGSGDPRLVNGVLEWPRTVTNEPFLVVRGDDGVLYYVGIATARRDASLAGGGRVAVLGLEGRTAHEITALGVGAGESIEAALASLQGARPAPAASAPPAASVPPAVVAPSATVTPTSPSTISPPVTATAPAPPASAVATAPGAAAPTPATSGGAAVMAPSNPSTAPAPAAPSAKSAAVPSAPAPAAPTVTSPAPAVTPPANGVLTHPNVISVPMPPYSRSAAIAPPPPVRRPATEVVTSPTPAALSVSASDERRWTEVSGVVESLVGRTLVLRSTEGRVAVDVSSLSQNLDRMITPGATVRVYGIPVEMRFKAMGFFDPGTRP